MAASIGGRSLPCGRFNVLTSKYSQLPGALLATAVAVLFLLLMGRSGDVDAAVPVTPVVCWPDSTHCQLDMYGAAVCAGFVSGYLGEGHHYAGYEPAYHYCYYYSEYDDPPYTYTWQLPFEHQCPAGMEIDFNTGPEPEYCMPAFPVPEADAGDTDENLGCDDKAGGSVGNPCDPVTGNKYLVARDLEADSLSDLQFTRYYNSQDGRSTGLGMGWMHTYGRVLEIAQDSLLYRDMSGRGYRFERDGATWVTDTDTHVALVEDSTGFTLRVPGQRTERYSSTGRLERITGPRGAIQTLTYDTLGRLEQVDTSTGEYLLFGYDESDRVATVSDHTGRSWGYRYDTLSNLRFVDNPDGTTRQYHYEDANFPHALTGITDERGIRYATYAYDDQGRAILSTHAGNAQRVDIAYHTDGTRTVTNSRGQSSTYNTAVQLGVALVTDISGPGCSTCGSGDTSYEYDPANNNLLSRTEQGVTTQYGNYDSKGQYGFKIEAVGTPEERRTDYSYDPRFYNKITSITEPSVAPGQFKVTSFTYDEWGNRTSKTESGFAPGGNPVSRSENWQYGGDGTPECDAVPLHQLCRHDGPRTDVPDITQYDYYPDDTAQGPNRARLRAVIDAHGVPLRANIQYTPTGKVSSEVRPNGVSLSYTYYPGNDRLETLTETDNAETRVTRWTYLPTGEVESITQGHGTPQATTLSFGYDDARRLARLTDGLGNYIQYQLDTEGNREFERIYDSANALKKQVQQTFDLYNRLDLIFQANEVRNSDFAPDGTLDRSTDGQGAVTDYSYDALKRLTQITQDQTGSDPATANATTQYHYDVADRLTTVTDPVNGTTVYIYDDLGNLLSQSSPDTGVTSFTYDAAGNLKTKQDAKGQLFTYHYDALNRLTLLDAPGTAFDVTYSYDSCGEGRLCSLTTDGNSVDYSYNAFGEVTEHQGISYTYDAQGRTATQTYPSGARVNRHYDPAGRIENLVLDYNGITFLLGDIRYTPFGPMTQANLGNGLSLTQSFDQAYRTTAQTVTGVQQLGYDLYDANGNLKNRSDSLLGSFESFDYDALNRLGTANGPFGSRDYDYDRNGNRQRLIADGVMTDYSYDPASNRLSGLAAQPVLLDPNGNLESKPGWMFSYTPANRLRTAEQNGTPVALYFYNGLGQRHTKSLPAGPVRQFRYGLEGELLAELDGNGQPLREYIYLDSLPVALLDHDQDNDGVADSADNCIGVANFDQRDTDGDGYGNRCDADFDNSGFVNAADLAFFRQQFGTTNPDADLNGSGFVNFADLAAFRSLFGAAPGPSGPNGQAGPARVHYIHTDHLGTPKAMTDASGAKVWSATHDPFGKAAIDANSTVTLNLRFPGQYFDSETGLHYNGNRYYDPSLGRYITSDPIGLEGGLNTYLYATANPIRFTDPLGLAVQGSWIESPRFNLQDVDIYDWGFVSPSFSAWGYLQFIRLQGRASGFINIDVKCKDDCREWEVHDRVLVDASGSFDVGPNLYALGAGFVAGPYVGVSVNIAIAGAVALQAEHYFLSLAQQKAGPIIAGFLANGPTLICLGTSI